MRWFWEITWKRFPRSLRTGVLVSAWKRSHSSVAHLTTEYENFIFLIIYRVINYYSIVLYCMFGNCISLWQLFTIIATYKFSTTEMFTLFLNKTCLAYSCCRVEILKSLELILITFVCEILAFVLFWFLIWLLFSKVSALFHRVRQVIPEAACLLSSKTYRDVGGLDTASGLRGSIHHFQMKPILGEFSSFVPDKHRWYCIFYQNGRHGQLNIIQ